MYIVDYNKSFRNQLNSFLNKHLIYDFFTNGKAPSLLVKRKHKIVFVKLIKYSPKTSNTAKTD